MLIYSVKADLRLVSVREEFNTLLEIRVLGNTFLVCVWADVQLNNLNPGLTIHMKHVKHHKEW